MIKRAVLAMAAMLMLLCLPDAKGESAMFNNDLLQYVLPNGYDLALAREKGLADDNGFTDEYFELQSACMEAIVDYVDAASGLRALDADMAGGELAFRPSPIPVSAYQQTGAFGMSFFFLRSGVHIERLSPAQLGELRACVRGEGDAAALLRQALPVLIRADMDEGDALQIIYEDDGRSAENAALVLGVAVSAPANAEGKIDYELQAKQNSFLDFLAQKLESELPGALGVPVRVMLY